MFDIEHKRAFTENKLTCNAMILHLMRDFQHYVCYFTA